MMINASQAQDNSDKAKRLFEENFADYLSTVENDIIKASNKGQRNVAISLAYKTIPDSSVNGAITKNVFLTKGERESLFRYLADNGYWVDYPVTEGQCFNIPPGWYAYTKITDEYFIVHW